MITLNRATAVRRIFSFIMTLSILLAGTVYAKTPISFWIGAQQPGAEGWYKEFEENFNKNNPDIQLEIRMAGDGTTMRENLVVAIAGGVAPDIHYESTNVMSNWIMSGAARPIDEFLDRMPGWDDLIPDLLESVQFNGKTYALPYAMWPIFSLYNMNLYEASGVSIPETWNEHVETTRRLTRLDADGNVEVYGYVSGEPESSAWAYIKFNHAMEQLGITMVESFATSGNIDITAGSQALRYRADLIEAGMRGAPRVGMGEFGAGQVAAIQGSGFSGWQLVDAVEAGASPFLGRFPGPTVGTDSVMHNANALFMVSTTRYPEEAWRVMQAFASVENLREYYMVDQHFSPVYRALLDDPVLLERPFALEQMRLLYPPIKAYGATHPLYPTFRLAVGEALMAAIRGEMPIESALVESQRLLDAQLATFKMDD